MNGTKGILDSNVIIFFSKRKIDIESLYSKYAELCVSIVSYIEVYAYEFEDAEERELIDRFFENVEIIDVNKEIADQTIIYRKDKTKKIKLADAIIIATAKIIEADLITDNIVDFQGIDASVSIVGIDYLRV